MEASTSASPGPVDYDPPDYDRSHPQEPGMLALLLEAVGRVLSPAVGAAKTVVLLPVSIPLWWVAKFNVLLSEALTLAGKPPPGFTSAAKVSEMSLMVEHLTVRETNSRAQLKDLGLDLDHAQRERRRLVVKYKKLQTDMDAMERERDALRGQLAQASARYKRAISGQGLSPGVWLSLAMLGGVLWVFHNAEHDISEYRIVVGATLLAGLLSLMTLLRLWGSYCQALIYICTWFAAGFVAYARLPALRCFLGSDDALCLPDTDTGELAGVQWEKAI